MYISGRPTGRRRFTWQAMLSISFSKTKAAKTLATIYKCAPKTIRRIQCAVAQVYLQTQIYIYGRILREFACRPPAFVFSNIMWDETGEKLKCPGFKSLSAEQRRTVCDVMITKICFAWGWLAGDNGDHPGDWRTYHFEVVCPPSLVLTPAAHHIWDALQNGPSLAPAMCFRRAFLQAGDVSVEVKECDGASGNDRLVAHWVAHERRTLGPKPMSQTVVCRNHRSHVESNVCTHPHTHAGQPKKSCCARSIGCAGC